MLDNEYSATCGISAGTYTPLNTNYSIISDIDTSIENVTTTYAAYMDEPCVDKEKGEKNMQLNFGSLKGKNIKMSMYGVAVKNNEGKYVSYNPKDKTIVDVNDFCFDAGEFLFAVPVGLKEIAAGDTILHNNTPVYVKKVKENGDIKVIDPKNGEKKTILLARNMLGFDYATKVVSLFTLNNVEPSADNPFGNLLPFLMMKDGKMDAMTLALMMQGGNKPQNPLMLAALLDNNKDKTSLLIAMMMADK